MMAQPAGKLTNHRQVPAIVRSQQLGLAADYEVPTGGQAGLIRKGVLDTFGKRPARQIHLGRSSVEQFNVLQFVQVERRVVHNLVDHHVCIRATSRGR